MPKVEATADTLAIVMGIDSEKETQYLDIPVIGESLCDVEYSESDITIYTHVPAHSYLWENLDRSMSQLGDNLVAGATYWQPQQRFHHLLWSWFPAADSAKTSFEDAGVWCISRAGSFC